MTFLLLGYIAPWALLGFACGWVAVLIVLVAVCASGARADQLAEQAHREPDTRPWLDASTFDEFPLAHKEARRRWSAPGPTAAPRRPR